MKNILTALLLLVCASCSRSKTTVQEITLSTGDTLILKTRGSMGLTEPTFQRTFFVHWSNGKKEELPFLANLRLDLGASVVETNGAIFVTTARGAAVRKGDKTKVASPWHIWSIEPSDDLYCFLERYAESKGNQSVSFTTYTCSKRLSPGVVHGTQTETNRTIRFVGTAFFFSPTRHTGWWLPHRLDSSDYVTREFVFKSDESLPSMPDALVFTGSSDLKEFVFNREQTERLLQQDAAHIFQKPRAVSENGER